MGIDPGFFEEVVAAKKAMKPGDDAAAIVIGDCKFHTEWRSGDNRRDLFEFRRRMGLARVETIDLYGNPTIRADLHEELPVDLVGKFDMVIDAGTLYCCFDVAQVWKNLLAMLKPGGIVIHLSALTGYISRGYYNFHPALYRDFYDKNGFELKMKVRLPKFFPRASLLRRVAFRLRRPSDGFVEIGNDDVFPNFASWRSIRFGRSPVPEVSILPNDAQILCIAQQKIVKPFTNPLPVYFASSDSGAAASGS